MTALVLSLTNAGLAAVQGASGSDPVVIAELGLTATPFEVAPTLTALPGEFKRIAAVSGTAAAANITHMTAYDTSSDVWNATGLGLWLADGTLFAVYSAGTTIINKAAVAFALVSFDIAWQADLAASVAFGDPIFTNPPATEEMRGLIQIATQDEADGGLDDTRALTPAKARLGLLPWLLSQDGSGSGFDADMLDGQHRNQIAPAGMIVMWSGTIASIPEGWALCDGANGTPDLRNRFLVGAGDTYAVGATGGALQHNHAITVDAAVTGITINTTTATVNGDGDPPNALTSATPNDPQHTHTASSENADSRPPYFALAFIMKL